jgi:hypothetical protein
MSDLFEQTFTLVLRVANAILEGRADGRTCAIALSAQGDQVASGLREAEMDFDVDPSAATLRLVICARAAFCGQVAGEELVDSFTRHGERALARALDAFDPTANALVRYVNAEADGDSAAAVAAVEAACALLPPDRRATLSG